MARGRFLSKSISTCEELGRVSPQAYALFLTCVPHQDVDGRLHAGSYFIKTQIVPYLDWIREEHVPVLLDELANARDHEGRPLVHYYEVGGERFLEFPGFHSHNLGVRRNREAKSRIPAYVAPAPTPGVDSRSSLPESTPGVNSREAAAEGSEVKQYPLRSLSNSEKRTGASEPTLTAQFLERFYGSATERRRTQVLAQLRQCLEPHGCPVDRTTRAYATRETLDRALSATLATDLRHADRAIVVLLRKLVKGSCNEIDPPGRREAAVNSPPPGRISTGLPAAGKPVAMTTLLPSADALALRADIDVDERAAALEWIQSQSEQLATIEGNVDRSMASLHPRWTNLSWLTPLRARRVEEAVVEAYRRAQAVEESPAIQEVG
jgi:hypothetical protein